MSNFDVKVGFSRVEINPPLGINLSGYFHKRLLEGSLDDLELNAVAVSKNGKTVLLISVDCESLTNEFCDSARQAIFEKTGIEKSAICIQGTHTHVGAGFGVEDENTNDIDRAYYKAVLDKLVLVSTNAINDLKNAKMGVGFSKAERIGFNRRYLMKDGSTATNPGVNNPNIVKSIGLLDEAVNVIRFEREMGDNVVIGNYGNHPDVIGGNLASADWLGFTRRIFEKAIDNTKCVFFNGAQGDINHVNVKPVGGDLNGMFNDFDDVTRGYAHSRHMGNVLAGALMSVYEKVEFISVDSVDYVEQTIEVASNMPTKEEMPEAYYIQKMNDEGRRDELPYKGMMLTTMLADAKRKIKLENGPATFPLNLSVIKVGEVAFVGIPGEPFAGIGLGLKENKKFKMVCPICLTNGNLGYFPMKDSFDEGGYEAKTSIYKAGVAETIIKEGNEILDKI